MEETNLTPEEQVIPKRKALGTVEKTPVLTDLEKQIIARSSKHNIAALCARFGVAESVVRAALAKK